MAAFRHFLLLEVVNSMSQHHYNRLCWWESSQYRGVDACSSSWLMLCAELYELMMADGHSRLKMTVTMTTK